jgi:3-oxoacyl-[acyl-carrier-protein] synthase II
MFVPATAADDPVVITGIGTMLPGTDSVSKFWENVSGGRSQVGPLTRFDPAAERLPVHAAAQITDFDHTRFLPTLAAGHADKYSREILITMSAVAEARRDANLGDDVDPERLGIVLSSSRGPLSWWQGAIRGDDTGAFTDKGAMFRGLPGCPATLSAIHVGAKGLVTTISNACVGGHQPIGLAMRELAAGTSDAVLVGGHEFPILPEVARCYLALGAGTLSREDRDPANAVRPYSADREGFALGEGSAVLCLERESHARERGATCYARIVGHRSINEAAHPTTMDLTGEVTADAVAGALADGGRKPDDVDYFCGHGTATKYNDVAESQALRVLYPERRPSDLPPLSSNKPIYGHTFGIAGIINVAATSLMLRHQRVAPTINLRTPDPRCDHDHVAGGARDMPLGVAVSMSFAFGSQTSMIAMERADRLGAGGCS